MPNLIFMTGVRRGMVCPLDGVMVIGRSVESDLQIPDLMVSSKHAQVAVSGDGFSLEDLGSTNGTFTNGRRVESVALQAGDVLSIGTTQSLYTEQETIGDEPVAVERIEPTGALDGDLTFVLSLEQQVELLLGRATDLTTLLQRLAEHLARRLEAKGVLIALDRGGRHEVVLCGWLEPDGLRLMNQEEAFDVKGSLLSRVFDGEGGPLIEDVGAARVCCLALPHARGTVGVVYLYDLPEGIGEDDVRPLEHFASLGAVHCRTHLLLAELTDRNQELEEARSRLARWNEQLQEAVEERTAELAISERSYRDLFEQSRDGNFTVDNRGRVLTINHAACRLAGIEPGAAINRPVWDVLGFNVSRQILSSPKLEPIDTTEFTFQLSAGLAENRAPEMAEVSLRTASGERRVVELLVRPMSGVGDEVVGVHGVLRDITRRREAEERMRLLSRIVENVPDAVVSTNLNGEVTSWNPGAERLYGFTPGEVLGNLLPTVPDAKGEELERILGAIAQGRSLTVRTERVDREDKSIPVLATFAPVPSADGEIVGLLELARDLSEQLRLEDQMRWGERLASFGELAAGLAHELGNPLANLNSGVEYLLDRPRDPDVARESLEMLQHEIERLQRLVQQTLDLARWKSPEISPLDPAEIVAYVANAVKDRAVDLGVRLETMTLEGGPPAIAGDADQLKQALLNLVSNAFRAMPSGGRLELGVVAEEGRAGFLVRDTGRGISHEDLERVFDLFYSAGSTVGAGIGLAIVKRIVDLHRGWIELESEPGSGTTIHLWLRLVQGAEPK